jgi:hypothetical protein
MTRYIQPPHLPEQRDLLDCIILMILFIILLYVLPLEAAEVWFKRQPGDKYWHRACTVTTAGVGPVEHYIPDGAVIAVRDGGVLVILTEGKSK